MTVLSFFFTKETLEALSKEVLKPIIQKYTNVIGYYVLDNDKFIASIKKKM